VLRRIIPKYSFAVQPLILGWWLKSVYDIDYDLFEVNVPKDSNLVGMTLDDIETRDIMTVEECL
jgi:hypothetical protein